MADRLERRFEGVDNATMPDLWAAIEVRAQRPAPEPRGRRIAALVLAVIVAAAVIGGLVWALQGRESQTAVTPGVNGDIGFLGVPPNAPAPNTDVMAVDPTTGVVQALTDTPDAAEFNPAWSADGTTVVFERDRIVSSSGPNAELVIRHADGSEQVLPCASASCTVTTPGNYALSPDGTKLALVTSANVSSLEVIDLATGETTTLCTQAQCGFGMGQIAWSPDGRQIAFSNFQAVATLAPFVTSSEPLPLHVVNVDGSDLRAVSPPFDTCPSVGQKHCGADAFPAWSPDGSSIAFIRVLVGPSTTTPMIVAADGSDGRVLAECEKGLTCTSGLAWSPDGASVAVPMLPETSAGSGATIRLVRISDGSIVDIPECSACQGPTVAWSPDGTSLVYIDDQKALAIHIDPADGKGPERVVRLDQLGGFSNWVAWLPAGAVPTASPPG
jgi:Tol biopolymer transport system component